jgi:UDP-glucose 4-epimerase
VKALVTGGAGFIGSALVERLLAEDYSVDVVDDLSTGTLASLAGARAGGERRLRFHQLDVRLPELAALMGRSRPDVVFHLAAAPGDDGSWVDPAGEADNDILGSLRLLEACRQHGVEKLVFASSPAIYGELSARDLPVKEGRVEGPISPRGVAKRAVSDYLRVYRDRYSLEFSALVLANVYGPGHDPGRRSGVVGAFAKRLVAEEDCLIDGDGAQTRDFVFVDDAVDAFARAATRGSGLIINVGTGKETSVNELYGVMAAAVGVQDPAGHGPARLGEHRRLALDPARAGIHLGWAAWTPLVEGIDATVEWWRTRASS